MHAIIEARPDAPPDGPLYWIVGDTAEQREKLVESFMHLIVAAGDLWKPGLAPQLALLASVNKLRIAPEEKELFEKLVAVEHRQNLITRRRETVTQEISRAGSGSEAPAKLQAVNKIDETMGATSWLTYGAVKGIFYQGSVRPAVLGVEDLASGKELKKLRAHSATHAVVGFCVDWSPTLLTPPEPPTILEPTEYNIYARWEAEKLIAVQDDRPQGLESGATIYAAA